MQKKEISELKKQFKYDDALTRVAGCYVDAEKNIVSVFSKSFATIDDTDRLKYMEIFKKVLSGSKGKQLMDAEYPIHSEGEDSMHAELMRLRADELKHESHLREFFEKVVAEYPHDGNFCILAAHDNYDVPGKGADGLTMDDASDTVHSFMVVALCPVELAKPGLSYHSKEEMFLSTERDWIVGAPEYGFTFPAFDDRMTNIHAMLVYDKKSLKEDFTTGFFDTTVGTPAQKQSEVFSAMIQDAFGDNVSVRDVTDVITEITGITEANPDMVTVNRSRVLDILDSCGADADDLEKSSQTYENELGDKEMDIDNLISTKSLSIEGDGVKITADIAYASRITEEKDAYGVRYIKIPIDNCIVNGIVVGQHTDLSTKEG